MTGQGALANALAAALQQDQRVHVLGEALELSPVTAGLRARAPERVHLLPASDAALVGVAVGMAMGGARPVVELAGPDALWGVLQQLGQEAATLSGEFSAPVIVRVPMVPGAGDPTGLLTAIKGLTLAAAGVAADGAGLLQAALQASGPVVLLEFADVLAAPLEPAESLPLGRARVARAGAHATALCWGAGVGAALAAADLLAGDGIALEVIDLRTLAPLDTATLGDSVGRTGRAILVGGGAAALLDAVRAAFLRLEAPPVEVPADAAAIAAAARAALEY